MTALVVWDCTLLVTLVGVTRDRMLMEVAGAELLAVQHYQ